ncbi:hypothetical protein GGI24_006859 [Coemansia furcata]|nr:hypothetical protein GGI24_006859 [Coemansia furcata]
MQELSQCTNTLGDAGSLFNVLLSRDCHQWLGFVPAHGKQLKALGVGVQKASDKMPGHALCLIVQAIDVAMLKVKVWIINVIRSGLIQGKMNQVARTLLPTWSTYRTFGADQRKLLGKLLKQWKALLEKFQPVISNAKLIAQQQAMQIASTLHVTIKE